MQVYVYIKCQYISNFGIMLYFVQNISYAKFDTQNNIAFEH